MQRNRWSSAVLGLIALGCGYHFVDHRHPLGAEVDRIEILALENRSAESGLERLLGDALVEEFARRGQFQPVYAGLRDETGVVLSGLISDVSIQPVAFSSVSLALEYEIRLVVNFGLVRGNGGAPLWEAYRIELRERFLESADPGVHATNKEEALQSMAAELAGRVHDVLVQTF
jgi:hypothetical protein